MLTAAAGNTGWHYLIYRDESYAPHLSNMDSVLGASGDPDVPRLGFRSDQKEGWPVPDATGLPGVYEG